MGMFGEVAEHAFGRPAAAFAFRLVGDAEARAATVLDRNWSTVEETAAALLEQETLSGVALDAVLSTVHEISIEELRNVRRTSTPRFTTRDPNPPR